MRQGPLAGRYAAVASMVMLALIPYLALSAALGPLTPIIVAGGSMTASGTTTLGNMAKWDPSAGGGAGFAVAVHEVNPAAGIGAAYTLTVNGACGGTCGTCGRCAPFVIW